MYNFQPTEDKSSKKKAEKPKVGNIEEKKNGNFKKKFIFIHS